MPTCTHYIQVLLIQCPNNHSLEPKPVATVHNAKREGGKTIQWSSNKHTLHSSSEHSQCNSKTVGWFYHSCVRAVKKSCQYCLLFPRVFLIVCLFPFCFLLCFVIPFYNFVCFVPLFHFKFRLSIPFYEQTSEGVETARKCLEVHTVSM